VVVFADHGDRAQGLRPDATYLVRDGALTEITSAPGPSHNRTRVELAGRGDPAELAASRGVESGEPTAGGVVLVIHPEDADALLAKALADGWSVRKVGPA
jgi:hypothetical protein